MRRVLDLDCGIAAGQLEEWLGRELCLELRGGAWAFGHEGAMCTVELTALEPRALGSVMLERNCLRISGDESAVDELYRLFILRFASAGG